MIELMDLCNWNTPCVLAIVLPYMLSMTCSLASCLDATAQMPYSLSTCYKKSSMWAATHSTWPLTIWKRHSIVYPDMSSGGLLANMALRSGWCSSYTACMKMPEAECMLVATWVKSSVWKWAFTKALAWVPLLFITVLEALSQEFRAGCSLEYLHAYNLVIITESLEELLQKLILWKTNMKGKKHWVNMSKTKVLISWPGLDVLQKSGKDPCGVCLKGVGTNSISFGGCSSWVHKKCSGMPGSLKPDPRYMYKRCTGEARPVDGKPMTGHSGSGEAWHCAILLLPWGMLILWKRLRTHYYHKMLCHMGQI